LKEKDLPVFAPTDEAVPGSQGNGRLLLKPKTKENGGRADLRRSGKISADVATGDAQQWAKPHHGE
jgi:hypothetical protein